MDELRALGVRLALDDFGTGRSSLERLDTFPLDALKIAKPFVDRLLDPAASPSFIDTFVQLAQSLEIDCIAEGIEHAAQVPMLLDRGCSLGQGFHFAPPMKRDRARPLPPDASPTGPLRGRLAALRPRAPADVSAPTSSAVATNARAAGEW